MNDSDSAMLNLISKVSLEGDAEVLESAVDFNFYHQHGDDNIKYFDRNIGSEAVEERVILSEKKQQTTYSSSKSVTLALSTIATSTTPNTTSKESSAKSRPKTRMLKKQIRFEETTKFTNRIADFTEQDVQIRREYYAAKLHLLERDVEAKERIAAACEVINSKVLSDIGNATTNADVTEDEDLSYEEVLKGMN